MKLSPTQQVIFVAAIVALVFLGIVFVLWRRQKTAGIPEAAMTNNKTDARDLALKRCDKLIEWYESQKYLQRFLDNVLQTLVILAAGLTAFAAAIQTWPRWAIVLPAVITTVATGLSTSFRFRTKYVNFAIAGERLKWVKLRYQIRSERAPTDLAKLEKFVNSMEAIVAAELAEWQGVLGKASGAKREHEQPNPKGSSSPPSRPPTLE